MITIKSKKEGFRRCGIAHSTVKTEYPDDRFSKAEIAALKAEPMLIVEELAGEGLSAMTNEQLKAEIIKLLPDAALKGVKKAELIEILKAHLGSAAAKG